MTNEITNTTRRELLRSAGTGAVAQGSMPMKFPDFTRGEEKNQRPTLA
jgi:hypothetical protein